MCVCVGVGGAREEEIREWIQYRNVEIDVGEKTGEAARTKHAKNMSTTGTEFGFLIIPRGIRRRTISMNVIKE